eukprot:CAMPEP_0115670480 /NCGR_PEP_ID=MMETSP0272-20121206/51554_1 /TAXON_ID=71861 /ORGANISM="Scrippsiella trochoidea, Strain CCMP3099" /LENGTH=70 /DNA_ID=CAMNT_0003109213 /DNA_START=502 /DNA_END=711 /DNA_ORIENTATION=-
MKALRTIADEFLICKLGSDLVFEDVALTPIRSPEAANGWVINSTVFGATSPSAILILPGIAADQALGDET